MHINNKVIKVSIGDNKRQTQKVQWLGDTAIARYFTDRYDGWNEIGIVKDIKTIDGIPLKPNQKICDTNLKDGSHIVVTTSIYSLN